MYNLTNDQLNQNQWKHYSQLHQDSILEKIFNQIGTTNEVAVEFGARDGVDLSNSCNFRLNHNWKTYLFDGNAKGNLVHKEHLTAENIEEVFSRHRVPKEFDYLSIDLDNFDWYVLKAIVNYSPRVISVEYNSNIPVPLCKVVEYDPNSHWDNFSNFYGGSLSAFKKLGNHKGYQLVGKCEQLDLFFVRNDLIDPQYIPPTELELLPQPITCHQPYNGKRIWVDV